MNKETIQHTTIKKSYKKHKQNGEMFIQLKGVTGTY